MKKYRVNQTNTFIAVIEAENDTQAIMDFNAMYKPDSKYWEKGITAVSWGELKPDSVIEEMNNAMDSLSEAINSLTFAIMEEQNNYDQETVNWEDSDIDMPRMELQDIQTRLQDIRNKL